MISKWINNIFNQNLNDEKKGELQKAIERQLPDLAEADYVMATCLSGLMARIAYADFEIREQEELYIRTALKNWLELADNEIQAITDLSIEFVQEFAGTQNHFYCNPLLDLWDNKQRHQLIKSLFHLAASDGQVANREAEEIRSINQCLRLTDRHFVAARAEVLEKLSIHNN
jgi:uncharacterized tellurite resistance protein B-like protein